MGGWSGVSGCVPAAGGDMVGSGLALPPISPSCWVISHPLLLSPPTVGCLCLPLSVCLSSPTVLLVLSMPVDVFVTEQ